MRFVDLFAGLGGFHLALTGFGGRCVYAVESDDELRTLYKHNHDIGLGKLGADITEDWRNVPKHDVLCAGFPCQPFSKSGAQMGRSDETRGTLFDFVLKIAKVHKPRLILLENVGNFALHDRGNTWRVVKTSLARMGYEVLGTEHVHCGGSGLLSPHHFGFPHVRERFFAAAALGGFHHHPMPPKIAKAPSSLALTDVIQQAHEMSPEEASECVLPPRHIACVNHWNEFIQSIPSSAAIPGFPIWADEFDATYPPDRYLCNLSTAALRRFSRNGTSNAARSSRDELLAHFPSYMSNGEGALPHWKARFITQNRAFYSGIKRYLRKGWLNELKEFPASHRKLEWNCHGEERDLWQYVLQFRPSGLRAKRFTSIPTLVAMTTTQIPILGPQMRYLSRLEGKRLQAMPDTLQLPTMRGKAFKALGNAVHVGVVGLIYQQAIGAVSLRVPQSRTRLTIEAGETYAKNRLAV